MSDLLLGGGELGATSHPGGIRTLALGSCVAVILLDPKTGCVGMDHVALPDSKVSPDKRKTRPGYFADTGIPELIESMKGAGAAPGQYRVKLVGGAAVMDPNSTFNIGKRNVLAIKKVLWRFGMGALAEDVGGQISRTVRVEAGAGAVTISSPGRPDWGL